jgi:hypothetical protein
MTVLLTAQGHSNTRIPRETRMDLRRRARQVDADTATPGRPVMLAGWEDFQLAHSFSRVRDEPLLVENDTNRMAPTEHRAWAHHPADHRLFVKVGSGPGCGITSNDTLHRGIAGEIAHIRLPGTDCEHEFVHRLWQMRVPRRSRQHSRSLESGVWRTSPKRWRGRPGNQPIAGWSSGRPADVRLVRDF